MDLRTWLKAQWDRALAVALVLLGALALLLGWLGIDDALYPGQQIPYVLSGGIGGLLAVGVGAVLWLSADLRDEWRKLDDIDQKLERILEHQASTAAAEATPVEPDATDADADAPKPRRKARAPRRPASDTGRRSRTTR
jgi:hypothetical protein